ncbi:MAG: helix-turn-helix domain-containing protein [Muribaculaceae bacterium]|nr:helix-turn-helix domain-containing protein [Muribaculaceae bacterium]
MNLQLIKNYCERRPGGLRQLAEEAGMSEANLHRCIRNNKIQASDLEKLSHLLKVSITEFFDETQSGSAIASGSKSAASYYGNAQVTTDNRYLESLLEEKDKRIELLETILKNNNLL